MAKEPTIFKAENRTYIIGNWEVDKALETFIWLTKTFGEGLITILFSEDGQERIQKFGSEENKSAEDAEQEKEMLSEFAAKVIDRLDTKEYVKYAKIIVSGTKCNAQDINFNQHFIGRMGELHRLILAILKHQYSDFLVGSGSEE